MYNTNKKKKRKLNKNKREQIMAREPLQQRPVTVVSSPLKNLSKN